MTTDRKYQVFLIDDHPIVRQGLIQLIDAAVDLHICGESDGSGNVPIAVAQARPNIVVLDLSLKDRSGLDLIKELKDLLPNTPVLVLSMHDETLHAERALRAGARGYIMKEEAADQVLSAIRRVVAGDIYLSDAVSEQMHQKTASGEPTSASPLQALTNRELEIFDLLGQGMTPREIAEKLSISIKTAEAHRENIKSKLNLKTGTQLLRFAIQHTMSR